MCAWTLSFCAGRLDAVLKSGAVSGSEVEDLGLNAWEPRGGGGRAARNVPPPSNPIATDNSPPAGKVRGGRRWLEPNSPDPLKRNPVTLQPDPMISQEARAADARLLRPARYRVSPSSRP